MKIWPHQSQALHDTRELIRQGCKSIVVCSPTGGGKTRIIQEIAKSANERLKNVLILTNRKILLSQASETFLEAGVNHGIMAAGYHRSVANNTHIASIQTIDSRVFRNETWELPEADVVLVDEAHANASKRSAAERIITHYRDSGSCVIGFTATPVGLGRIYTNMVQAGTTPSLIEKGILVPCTVFAPSEPDMRGISMSRGEYSGRSMRKRVMECGIQADVFKWFDTLNPDRKPTVMFAPGVAESKWFCEQFEARGITARHIDGETPNDERREIFDAVEDGSVQVVSSFGVLREGWNCPVVSHAILTQVCGAVSTYLQIVGRILRASPGKTRAVLQDHSGASWRHGPPDMERVWKLDDTDIRIAQKAKKDKKAGELKEGIICPECAFVREKGPVCPNCGHRHKMSHRRVYMQDGSLKKMTGPVIGRKKPQTDRNLWTREIFAGAYSNRTIKQMRWFFSQRNGYWPPDSVCPHKSRWGERVLDVYPFAAKSRKRK